MKEVKPLPCYFTRDERREIEAIADSTERPQTKVVQFAVRVFSQIYRENPERALALAQSPNGVS